MNKYSHSTLLATYPTNNASFFLTIMAPVLHSDSVYRTRQWIVIRLNLLCQVLSQSLQVWVVMSPTSASWSLLEVCWRIRLLVKLSISNYKGQRHSKINLNVVAISYCLKHVIFGALIILWWARIWELKSCFSLTGLLLLLSFQQVIDVYFLSPSFHIINKFLE